MQQSTERCSSSQNRAFGLGKGRRQSRHTNERGVQQTVVMCESEVVTENHGSQDPACEGFHDEFMMSRWHEPTVMVTRTSLLQDPYPQGPHNERARGVRHEDVASLVPACSGARVCHEQGREDSTGSADWSIKQCGIGREVPANHEAQGQKCSDDRRCQESEVADVRRTTAKRILES